MTGDVVNLGGDQAPSARQTSKALDHGRDTLAAHDPFRPVIESQKTMVDFLAVIADRIARGTADRTLLTPEQLAEVAQAARWGGQDGVRQQARSFERWAAVRIAGIAVLAAALAGFVTNYVDQGRVIDTQSALGAMRADDAAQWARIIRVNPPPQTWETRPVVASDGSNAAWALLRMQPPPKAPARPEEKGR